MKDNEQPDYIIDDYPSNEMNQASIRDYLGIKLNEEEEQYVDECSFKFSNLNNQKVSSLGKYDPTRKHLSVTRGINLKGMCQNRQCVAFMKKIWIQKGYGSFDMNSDRFKNKCPSCDSLVKYNTIKSFGFRNCQITIDGMRIENEEEEVEVKKTMVEKQGKLIYFTDYDQDISTWGYLKIQAKKI